MSVFTDFRYGLRYFAGSLSDIIVFNTSFTAANQKVVEGYLAYKLGKQSSLPIGHPYYSETNSIPVNIVVV